MVAAVGGAGVAVGVLLTAFAVGLGHSPFVVTPWLAVLFVLIGVWLLVAGRGVKRLKARQKTWITPVGAGRTAIFARSSAPITSAFAGLLLGVAIVAFTRSWAPAMAYAAWMALAGAVGSGFASISAVIVERWCIDEDDAGKTVDGHAHGGRQSAPGAGAGSSEPEPRHPRTASTASPDGLDTQRR